MISVQSRGMSMLSAGTFVRASRRYTRALRHFTSVTMDHSKYARERDVAIAAVLKASEVAQVVYRELVTEETVTKKDKSPVTVGDYTCQAIINFYISKTFPNDSIVGEEDSKDLTRPEQENVKNRVLDLVNRSLSTSLPSTLLQPTTVDWESYRIDSPSSESDLFKLIDRGQSEGGERGRMWALDPIDGTKGFLRGGQYAVCLGLIEDGEVVVGVIGCPNLTVDFKNDKSSKGTLFFAERGAGAFQRSFDNHETTQQIHMTKRTSETLASQGSFCESVESGHSDQNVNSMIAKELGITKPPVRMDSQAKYVSIARGDGDVYLRLPVSATYEEKIWDHAAGSLIVAEAGGRVTDMNGASLNFRVGRTLKENKGIVAAYEGVHSDVIGAVKKAVKGNGTK